MSSRFVSLVAVFALAVSGCKKQQPEGASTAKTTEGSGSATAPAAADPTAGSAAPDPTKAAPAAEPAPAAATKNLVETARGTASFSTFAKAVDAAGIADKLAGAGPFTVLVPTDEAFAKLPSKDLDALLADKAKLAAVLEAHIIPGSVASKDLAAQKSVKTVQGGELAIDAAAGVKIGGAAVVTPDVVASNGVIHAIDTVLVPGK